MSKRLETSLVRGVFFSGDKMARMKSKIRGVSSTTNRKPRNGSKIRGV